MGLLYTDSVRLYNLIYFCCQMIYGQNVGIGTTSPTAALHVNGSLNSPTVQREQARCLPATLTGKANWVTIASSAPTVDENVVDMATGWDVKQKTSLRINP